VERLLGPLFVLSAARTSPARPRDRLSDRGNAGRPGAQQVFAISKPRSGFPRGSTQARGAVRCPCDAPYSSRRAPSRRSCERSSMAART
jgi:hypothetical protein